MKLGRLQRWRLGNPLAIAALVAVTGVLLAETWQRTPWPSIIAVVVALGLLARAGRRVELLVMLVVAATFAGLHALRLRETYQHPLRERLQSANPAERRATIQAHLLPWADGAELDLTRARGTITSIKWRGDKSAHDLTASARIVLPRGMRIDAPGRYELIGDFFLPRPAMNPGQFDAVDYSLRMGQVASFQANSLRLVKAEPWSLRFHLLDTAERCRTWMKDVLSLGLEKAPEEAAVVLAMALGASDAAGEEIEDAFRNSGTLHIFAVSGLHVVMVATVLGWLLRWLGLGRTRFAWALIALVFAYAFITGWRPSAARAALMIAVVLAAPLFNRRSSLQNNLGAAALLLLAMDTHQLFMPGFQLSFGVLWAIALAASWLMQRARPWTELDPFLPSVLASRAQRGASSARKYASSLGAVSAAAWVGSLPLLVGHFHTITPVGLVANCLLVPMSSFCIGFSCLSVCCACLGCTWGQVMLNWLNGCLAKSMVIAASWFASLPGANVYVPSSLGGLKSATVEMQVLHLTGGGSATYLRNGNGHWLLDCGNGRNWRRIVLPYLRQHGVNHLNGVFLSHTDSGHVGSIVDVTRAVPVALVHSSPHEPWRYDPPSSTLRRLSQLMIPDSASWQRHGIGDDILLGPPGGSPVIAEVLHPAATDVHEKADDRALVLKLQMGRLNVLWLSDGGFVTEKSLLERHKHLRCDVLIRGQHSADQSALPEFLLAVDPQVIISTSDADDPSEFLPEHLRKFCAERSITLFNMSESGSVSLCFRGDELAIEGFHNGQSVAIQPR